MLRQLWLGKIFRATKLGRSPKETWKATRSWPGWRRFGPHLPEPASFIIGIRNCTFCSKQLFCAECVFGTAPGLLHVSRSRHTTIAGNVAQEWYVNTDIHIVRKSDYKGSKQKHELNLAFDAFTMPGLLFVVPWLALWSLLQGRNTNP